MDNRIILKSRKFLLNEIKTIVFHLHDDYLSQGLFINMNQNE